LAAITEINTLLYFTYLTTIFTLRHS